MLKKISTGQQGYLGLGVHNPIIHTVSVTIGWIKIFRKLPTIKEFICIFFHDVGYIVWQDTPTFIDNHPEMGAKLCGMLLGRKYFNLCIAHSREYAYKNHLEISKLCYADKYSNIVYPKKLFNFFLFIGGTYRWAQMNKWKEKITAKGENVFYSTNIDEILFWYKYWLIKNNIKVTT